MPQPAVPSAGLVVALFRHMHALHACASTCGTPLRHESSPEDLAPNGRRGLAVCLQNVYHNPHLGPRGAVGAGMEPRCDVGLPRAASWRMFSGPGLSALVGGARGAASSTCAASWGPAAEVPPRRSPPPPAAATIVCQSRELWSTGNGCRKHGGALVSPLLKRARRVCVVGGCRQLAGARLRRV